MNFEKPKVILSDRFKIKTTDTDTSLTVNGIEFNDDGEYSCKLTNSEGIEISNCQIEVKNSEQITVKTSKIQDQKYPGFTKYIESQNLMEGEPLILECEVNSNYESPVDIIWLRNGKQIPENPDFVRSREANKFKLFVNEIFPEDSGVFSAELICLLNSQTVMSSCSVFVQGVLIILKNLI